MYVKHSCIHTYIHNMFICKHYIIATILYVATTMYRVCGGGMLHAVKGHIYVCMCTYKAEV